MFSDFEDWGNVKDVNDISTVGRELTQSGAQGPVGAPRRSEPRSFEDEIKDAIASCKRKPGGRRIWMYGNGIKGTNIRIRMFETKRICRCACHRANACNAINYEKNAEACVFHSGGTPERKFGWWFWHRKAWVKA